MSLTNLRLLGSGAILLAQVTLTPSLALAQPTAPPPPAPSQAPSPSPSEPTTPPVETPSAQPPTPNEPPPPPTLPPPVVVTLPVTPLPPGGYLPPPTPFSDPVSNESPPMQLPTSHWELGLDATVSNTANALQIPTGGLNRGSSIGFATQVWGGSGSVGLTRFIHPVVDDATPRSLQPFLQHAGWVGLGITIDGSSGPAPGPSTTGLLPYAQATFTEVGVEPVVDFNAYVTREVAITGGFSYNNTHYSRSDGATSENQTIRPNLGLGLHFGDTRVDGSYLFTAFASNGTFASPQWGQLSLGVESVFAKRVSVNVTARAFHAGGGGSAGVEVFINKSIGVYLEGYANDHRRFIDDDVAYNEYGGDLGAGFWVIPRLRLTAQYAISGQDVPNDLTTVGYSVMRNVGQLSATLRL